MNWKLLAGRMIAAWRAYPQARRRVAAVPAGPPIFLTGTHRSGTTWLAGMLAASGIWYVHEPYFPGKGRWPRSFDYRESGQRDPNVDALFEDVLSGGFRSALQLPNADHPWMPLRMLRTPFQRVLVKDPIACLLTEYLTRNFGLQTLILFRHPAGFAASIRRLGWPRGVFLRQFLADQPLMRAHLQPYRAVLQRFAQEDSLASATALHGALSTVLWRFVSDGVGTPLIFEQLCADPLDRLRDVFAQVQLPYDDTVRDAHRHACLGKVRPVDDYHPHAVARNSMAMADSWRKQLSDTEQEQVRSVWSEFNVPLYQEDRDWIGKGTPTAMTGLPETQG